MRSLNCPVALIAILFLSACTPQQDQAALPPAADQQESSAVAVAAPPLTPLEQELKALDCEHWSQLGRDLARLRDEGRPLSEGTQLAETSTALKRIGAARAAIGRPVDIPRFSETLSDYVYYQIPGASASVSAAALNKECHELRVDAMEAAAPRKAPTRIEEAASKSLAQLDVANAESQRHLAELKHELESMKAREQRH